jgi:diguanylate cyclase (GGDEF)-like protein/PAS domain S-box-containing protein
MPRRWVVSGLVIMVVASAAHVLSPDAVVGQGGYLMATAGGAAVAWMGARQHGGPLRFAWVCVALGVAFSALGDIAYAAFGPSGGGISSQTGSMADAFWVVAYVSLVLGLSCLMVGGHGRRLDVDALIDIGTFAVLGVIVLTQFPFVRDIIVNSAYSLPTRLIGMAYPVLDATLFAVVIHAVFGRRVRGRGGVLVICGVILWIISDIVSFLITDSAKVTSWLDVGWMFGVASFAAAAWPESGGDPLPEVSFKVVRVTNSRVAISLLPLAMPGVIKIWEFNNGRHPNPVPLFASTVALVVLAFARSTRLVQARNRQELAMERSTHFYAALTENSSDIVIVIDAQGRILNDSPNLAKLLGRPGWATTGVDAVGLLLPVDRPAARETLQRWRLSSGVVSTADVRTEGSDGSDRWFGVRATNLSDDPVVGGIVLNLRDITARKRAEQELSHSAFHDSLTGLANRALFHDRLEHALERTARSGMRVAVVYLDLDGFKTVNDSRGHEAGDRVLGEVAVRLCAAVRAADTVSRLGGDEFAILTMESPRALDEAETIAERVLQSLTEPFIIGVERVVLSASIGIAVGDNSCTASSIMRDVDVAMYKAKTTGKSKWALYEPSMRTAALDLLELENELRQAVDCHQLRLLYQPIVELKSNQVVGFEALLRWDHPTRGVVEPDTFIPIAEGNGSIVAIGQWVLDEACRTAAEWHRRFPTTPLTMAVNVSARQIATPDIVGHVAAALEHSGFSAASLILEMTESVLVHDAETAGQRLQELRSLGVRLAIDDFGTGYSSLAYLRQFPIDILKIDKSFTDTITESTHVPAIVRGLLDLANTLHLETIAEGIELDVQRISLRHERCGFGQGFLFAKPLEAAALMTRDGRRDVGR